MHHLLQQEEVFTVSTFTSLVMSHANKLICTSSNRHFSTMRLINQFCVQVGVSRQLNTDFLRHVEQRHILNGTGGKIV
jgi:hypothetical protein